MLRLVSNIFTKIWGAEEDEETRNDQDRDPGSTSVDGPSHASPEVSQERVPPQSSGTTPSSDGTTPSSDGTNDLFYMWQFIGHVTSLHDGYGLIDQQVYFSFHITKTVPEVGAKVLVKAQRFGKEGGWRASFLSLVVENQSDWVDNSSESSDEVVLGKNEMVAKVTNITTNGGCLNNVVSFNISCVKQGYVPVKDDWVVARTEVDDTSGTLQVLELHPLREYSFEGEVSSVRMGMGYIDYDIYFTFGVCESGYRPQRGDYVYGQAVENGDRRCSWRAVKVLPLRRSILPSISLPSPSRTKSLDDLLANKEGISISPVLSFGNLHQGETKRVIAHIGNVGKKPTRYLGCQLCVKADSQFSGGNVLPEDIDIQPGSTIMVTFTCHARNLGHDQQLVVFNFDGFKIGRHLTVAVGDSMHQTDLDPDTPYMLRKNIGPLQKMREARSDTWIVPGQKPKRTFVQIPNRLPQFPIPSTLETVYLDRGDILQVAPVIKEELTIGNYTRRFSVLLHLEEIAQNIEIRQFDLERKCMRRVGEYLGLAVPGLAEGRPSVLVGDRVIASSPTYSEHEPEYEGFVHEVLDQEVLLKFSENFHNKYMEEDFNFRFTFNRVTLRRCHQAVGIAPSLGEEVLFPTKLTPKVPQTKVGQSARSQQVSANVVKASPASGIRKCPLRKQRQSTPETDQHQFFNNELNVCQKTAVLRILSGQCRPTPYVLFGPPGTGKTVTMVEAILQVLHHIPSSRIVACAPSNSAADLTTLRLHLSGHVKLSELVRLNAFTRSEEGIPKAIRAYCQDGSMLEIVARHRIIVCTCASSARLYNLGLRPGHYTHVFIDEAGQATEPEAMTPLSLVAGTDGQIVLSGDPFQLGPVLRNKQADQYGLGLSILERLISRTLYLRDEARFADHGNYDPLLVTKLVQNYRSHPALLKVPSMLFYHGELQESADRSLTHCLCQWPTLPNQQGFPIIFHGLRGQDMREGSSPSWFNPMEAIQVIKYLQSLIENTVHPISWKDIGIITPYRKQVEKIALLICKLGMDMPKVSSVEEFQGQERLVIILSTVRSNEGQVKSDILHNLGFLLNPKRFNVSITRAQALLIIVGNPHILSQDPYWNVLLQYCVKNKAYVGCDLPDLEPTDLDLVIQTDSATPTSSSADVDKDGPDPLTKDSGKWAANSDEVSTPDTDNTSNPCSPDCTTREDTSQSIMADNKDKDFKEDFEDDDICEGGLEERTKEKYVSEIDEDSKSESSMSFHSASSLNIDDSATMETANTANCRSPDVTNGADKISSHSGNVQIETPKQTSLCDQVKEEIEDTMVDNLESVEFSNSSEPKTEVEKQEKFLGNDLQDDAVCAELISQQTFTTVANSSQVVVSEPLDDPQGRTAGNVEKTENDVAEVDSADRVDSTSPPKFGIERNSPKLLSAEGGTSSFQCTGRGRRIEALLETVSRQKGHTSCTMAQSAPNQMESLIIRQIEYYFSNINLSKDTFMKQQMRRNNGWVPLAVLTTFNRLKAITTDHTLILSALSKSTSGLIKLDLEAHRVGRSDEHPLPTDYEVWKRDLKDRSAFVEGLKTSESQGDLEAFFTQWGSVEHVHKLRPYYKYVQSGHHFTFPLVVIFEHPFSASSLVMAGGVTYQGESLHVMYRSNICEMIYNDRSKATYQHRPTGRGEGRNRTHMDPCYQHRPTGRGEGRNRTHMDPYFQHMPTGRGEGPNRTHMDPRYQHRHRSDTPTRSGRNDSMRTGKKDQTRTGTDDSTKRSERRRRHHCQGDSRVTSRNPPFMPLRQDADKPTGVGLGRGRGLVMLQNIEPPSSKEMEGEVINPYSSLEQRDSDVIVESSDEEF